MVGKLYKDLVNKISNLAFKDMSNNPDYQFFSLCNVSQEEKNVHLLCHFTKMFLGFQLNVLYV